ncbi:MAG: hypothetical protein AABY15_01070 [Nanoarchaeota archaeon]
MKIHLQYLPNRIEFTIEKIDKNKSVLLLKEYYDYIKDFQSLVEDTKRALKLNKREFYPKLKGTYIPNIKQKTQEILFDKTNDATIAAYLIHEIGKIFHRSSMSSSVIEGIGIVNYSKHSVRFKDKFNSKGI